MAKKLKIKFLKTSYNWLSSKYFFPVLLMLVSGSAFIKLTIDVVSKDKSTHYDTVIINTVNEMVSPFLTAVFLFITKFGAEFIFLFFIIFTGIALRKGYYKEFYLVSGVTLGGGVLVNTIKNIISRTRPITEIPIFKEEGFSYPSGHATAAVCFYGILMFLTYRHIKNLWIKALLATLLILIIMLVGVSRVYLGVHFPSDVVAGYYLGVSWISFCLLLYNFFLEKNLKNYEK